jgi:hypothetical protein
VHTFWEENPHLQPRDAKIDTKDVQNMKESVNQHTYRLDGDEAASVEAWALANPEEVLFYQRFIPASSTHPGQVRGDPP